MNMKVNDWVEELRNQLKSFDAGTLDCEMKMADITLGYVDTQDLIHYHKIEYRAKGFEKKPALSRTQQS
jgi:hypothetical protein